MSWLDDEVTPVAPKSTGQDLQRQWLDKIWYVERDLRTEEFMVATGSDGNPWLHLRSRRLHVVAASSAPPEEVDCAEKTGREWRREVRHSSRPELAAAGIRLHNDRDDDGEVVVWPAASTTQRIHVD